MIRAIILVLAGSLLSVAASADVFKCNINDPIRPAGWPKSYLEIRASSGHVTNATYVDFAPDGNKFEEFRDTLISIKDHIRGGYETSACIDDGQVNETGGEYASLCKKVKHPNIDLLSVSLTFSKLSPGSFLAELTEKNSENITRRQFTFDPCE